MIDAKVMMQLKELSTCSEFQIKNLI